MAPARCVDERLRLCDVSIGAEQSILLTLRSRRRRCARSIPQRCWRASTRARTEICCRARLRSRRCGARSHCCGRWALWHARRGCWHNLSASICSSSAFVRASSVYSARGKRVEPDPRPRRPGAAERVGLRATRRPNRETCQTGGAVRCARLSPKPDNAGCVPKTGAGVSKVIRKGDLPSYKCSVCGLGMARTWAHTFGSFHVPRVIRSC